MKRFLLFFFAFILAFVIFGSNVHAQVYTTDKLITIDTSGSMLYAWEGGQVVNQSPVATGMYYTPTVKGIFKIYMKVPIQDMKGNYPPYEPYNLKDVPNVMYFYQDYAIHGAYWHNNFWGRRTHGCVNTPVEFSKWLFDWTPYGTQVYIF